MGRGGEILPQVGTTLILCAAKQGTMYFFAFLTHPLSVEKRYMHSLLKFDSGTGLVFSPFLSRLNEFQGKLM